MNSNTQLPRFAHQIRVRFADTDLQGHVFFGNYYTYLDEAFMAYLRKLGFSWDVLKKMGLGVYYVDSGCQFKGPAYFEDSLKVYTQISKTGNSSLTAEMTVVRENEDIAAAGFIIGVMVDSKTEKSVPIPEELRTAISNYQDR